MANINVINKFEKDFKDMLEEKDGFHFDVEGINLMKKENYKNDLSKLICCSKNYYEDLIKVYTNNEYVIEVEKDAKINIFGSAILYVIVKKNSTLNLNFEDKDFSAVYVKILVEENIKLNLIEFSNSKELHKNIEVVSDINSQVIFSQFSLNSKVNVTEIKLAENVEAKINSFYYGNSNNFYLLSKAHHLSPHSSSDIIVRGAVSNGANIISDGLVKIDRRASKSKGFQNMRGLILDRQSSISSEPILEIENNDVSCSHGSSISQINEDILFYMQSRGISKKDAVNLVLEGFYVQIAENIYDMTLREEIIEKIENEL